MTADECAAMLEGKGLRIHIRTKDGGVYCNPCPACNSGWLILRAHDRADCPCGYSEAYIE